MPDAFPHVVLDARKIARVLYAAAAGFIALGTVAVYFSCYLHTPYVHGFVPLFHMDYEGNLPTFFSSLLLLLSGVLCWRMSQVPEPHARRWGGYWRVLGSIFILMAIDESVALHEKTVEPLREYLHTQGYLYFAWVVLGGAFALVMGAAYFRFLMELEPPARRRILLAGLAYLMAVLGLEMIGGNLAYRTSLTACGFQIESTVEEGLEMLALIYFNRALMLRLQVQAAGFSVVFGSRNTP